MSKNNVMMNSMMNEENIAELKATLILHISIWRSES